MKIEFTEKEIRTIINALFIQRTSMENSARFMEKSGLEVPEKVGQEIQHLLSLENRLSSQQLELDLGLDTSTQNVSY